MLVGAASVSTTCTMEEVRTSQTLRFFWSPQDVRMRASLLSQVAQRIPAVAPTISTGAELGWFTSKMRRIWMTGGRGGGTGGGGRQGGSPGFPGEEQQAALGPPCLLLAAGEDAVAVGRKLGGADDVLVLELVELVAGEGIPDLRVGGGGGEPRRGRMEGESGRGAGGLSGGSGHKGIAGTAADGFLTLMEKSADAVAARSAGAFKEADHTAPCGGGDEEE